MENFMKKMLHGRILDYTSIIFMTVVFISLYYFRMSSHLYGFLLFLSFFPYFFKLFLTQQNKEEIRPLFKGRKISLISFLLTNFIIFIFFIIPIIYGVDFFRNACTILLLFLSFYLLSKDYYDDITFIYYCVIIFSIISCWNKEHSIVGIISYVVYMYTIISKLKTKTSDKYLSKA